MVAGRTDHDATGREFYLARALGLAAMLRRGLGVWEYQVQSRMDHLRETPAHSGVAPGPGHRERDDTLSQAARTRASSRTGERGSRQRFRPPVAAELLALLPSDPGELDYLHQRAASRRGRRTSPLSAISSNPIAANWSSGYGMTGKTRAAIPISASAPLALARFAPNDPRWKSIAREVTGKLVTENPLFLNHWIGLSKMWEESTSAAVRFFARREARPVPAAGGGGDVSRLRQ